VSTTASTASATGAANPSLFVAVHVIEPSDVLLGKPTISA
jgi:hypothetical protein